MALAEMFPRQLILEVSQRCAGEDRERDHQLCDELHDDNKKVDETLRAGGLREIYFKDLTDDDDKHHHIAALKSTLARVDR